MTRAGRRKGSTARIGTLATALAGVVLVLAACGGGEDSAKDEKAMEAKSRTEGDSLDITVEGCQKRAANEFRCAVTDRASGSRVLKVTTNDGALVWGPDK